MISVHYNIIVLQNQHAQNHYSKHLHKKGWILYTSRASDGESGDIRPAEDIVRCRLIKVCTANQDIRGQIPISLLIAEILGLLHPQIIGNLFLRQVMIFPQVAQTPVICHVITLYPNSYLDNSMILC